MENKNDLPADVMAKGFAMAIEEVIMAYPIDIFPDPTHEEYEEMNKTFSSFVTRNSASMGRHIAKVIQRRAMEFANDLLEGIEAVEHRVHWTLRLWAWLKNLVGLGLHQ